MLIIEIYKQEKKMHFEFEKSLTISNISELKEMLDQILNAKPSKTSIMCDGEVEVDFSFCQLLYSFWLTTVNSGFKIEFSDAFVKAIEEPMLECAFSDFRAEMYNSMILKAGEEVNA